jgi:hypothetical protein
MPAACAVSLLSETSDATRSTTEDMALHAPILYPIQSPLIAYRYRPSADGPVQVFRRVLVLALALSSGLVISYVVPLQTSFPSLTAESHALDSQAKNGRYISKDALRQQQIANAIAFTFARELGHWSASAVHAVHNFHHVQQLGESNTSFAENRSSVVSAPERSEASRGREGPPQPAPQISHEVAADGGSPGFEESWVGVPSMGTDVPQGLAGSNSFVLDDVEEFEQDLLDTWKDNSITQSPSQPEAASNRFFPFGRDEIVEVQPSSAVAPADFQGKPESFSGSGLLSDEDEPNSEEDALRVVDEYVVVPAAVPASAHQEGSDNGVADVFPDELVGQDTVEAQPRGHREHTDFDLQGSLPDLLVPASSYDARLGEDVSPAGLQDAAVHVPPARSLAAQPRLGEGLSVPAEWGDRYVASDGDVTTDDGRVTNPEAAAAGDWGAAQEAADGWDLGEAVSRAARAALEEAGIDLDDLDAPPQADSLLPETGTPAEAPLASEAPDSV